MQADISRRLRASNDAVGLNTAKTNVTWTVNSSGLSLDAGAYLTTAALSTMGLYASSNTYLTSSGTHDARSLSFRGDKNITVGISASEVVFSVGNYLTTARASTDAVGLNTAKTNVTWTVNSSGISLDGGAYLTTQTQSDRRHVRPREHDAITPVDAFNCSPTARND
jgi:hypothetical protein